MMIMKSFIATKVINISWIVILDVGQHVNTIHLTVL